MTSENTKGGEFIGLTANIVSAYVSNNTVPATDIPGLINQVHAALVRVSGGHAEAPSDALKPAVPVKKSITPEQYREKWSLPPDYPMVAPNYAAARSQLARQMGLGQQRRRRAK